ncbi:MAG: heavy-metal-associated domain-containing protein [Flavipsychrobacter sp.]
MNILKFKTNIKCTGCEAKVKPFLDETAGEDNWEVDLQSPEKTLSVIADRVTEAEVVDAIKKAGYTAEPVK